MAAYRYPWEEPEPDPDVSGPWPGAIDAQQACASLGYALDRWKRFVF